MTDCSATATIKGYFYQFDQTIVRLIEATRGACTPAAAAIRTFYALSAAGLVADTHRATHYPISNCHGIRNSSRCFAVQ